ncbi:MAG: JAB domain-containing protein [Steroidobacteraceae bacterium]
MASSAKAHNHPSGVAEPSQADELVARKPRETLQLVALCVLDHLSLSGSETLSAERGLI